LVCTCEIVRVEDALVVGSSGGASWSALEKHFVLVIGVVLGLGFDYGAGLGAFCRFRCGCSGALSSVRFDFYLVDGQMVLIFAIFTSDGITELFKTLGTDSKLLSDGLLSRVISEEDEGLEGSIRVSLLVDTPQDMVEERLEIDRYRALGRLIGTGHLGTIASGMVRRCLGQCGCLFGVCDAIGKLGCLARTRTKRLGGLGHVLEAVRGADRGAVRHVEGVEGAL
jgi:hypothetical protein